MICSEWSITALTDACRRRSGRAAASSGSSVSRRRSARRRCRRARPLPECAGTLQPGAPAGRRRREHRAADVEREVDLGVGAHRRRARLPSARAAPRSPRRAPPAPRAPTTRASRLGTGRAPRARASRGRAGRRPLADGERDQRGRRTRARRAPPRGTGRRSRPARAIGSEPAAFRRAPARSGCAGSRPPGASCRASRRRTHPGFGRGAVARSSTSRSSLAVAFAGSPRTARSNAASASSSCFWRCWPALADRVGEHDAEHDVDARPVGGAERGAQPSRASGRSRTARVPAGTSCPGSRRRARPGSPGRPAARRCAP